MDPLVILGILASVVVVLFLRGRKKSQQMHVQKECVPEAPEPVSNALAAGLGARISQRQPRSALAASVAAFLAGITIEGTSNASGAGRGDEPEGLGPFDNQTSGGGFGSSHRRSIETIQSSNLSHEVHGMAFDQLGPLEIDDIALPGVNPANGLPMLPGNMIDVVGNPYGTDSHHSVHDLGSQIDVSTGSDWESPGCSDTHLSTWND